MFFLPVFSRIVSTIVTVAFMVFSGPSLPPPTSSVPTTTTATSTSAKPTPDKTTPVEPTSEETTTEDETTTAEPTSEETTSEETTTAEPTSEETTTEEETTTAEPTSEETTTVEPTEPTEEPGLLKYVGLGDSYAALGSTDVEHTGPANCYRSTDNYGGNIIGSGHVEGEDISCSGAETDSITGWQFKPDDNSLLPPQIDQLEADTELITLTIGANDLGYWDVFQCFQGHIMSMTPSDCATKHGPNVETELTKLPAKLDDVYTQIKDRSPNARIITGGYMPLLAPEDNCTEITLISQKDREWIIDFTNELNVEVKAAAERNGATYVMPDNVEEHTGCAPYKERYVDFFGTNTGAYPFHPTALGHRVMAQAMLDAI
ncbi:SGNH/GDSL hydrolase family protein [Corynebacterium breve]|uniref:SGNH/GDSL hydrolase family protein n=1 Tax=Corynebacterium breve TaxID=3049799 RepID=A0ABY8VBP1_9CORY|nr:SGNH/GDSL hydrolase family protein [Corynebacterium breve]WIM67051.1 SGNH/GDSL hydrolase family protein [Corynebacterium breve]